MLHETALGRQKEEKLQTKYEGSCSLKIGRMKKQYLEGLERRNTSLAHSSLSSSTKDMPIYAFRGKLPPKD